MEKVYVPRKSKILKGLKGSRRKSTKWVKSYLGSSIGKGSLPKLYGKDPFKPYMNVRLHYSETFILASGTSGVVGTEQVTRLNSGYDVNFSGTGAQPYAFDTMALIYKKYFVKGCLVKITCYDPNAEGLAAIITIQPSGTTTTLTGQGLDALQMQPNTWVKYIPTTGSQQKVFKQYVNFAKLEGLNRINFEGDIDEYGAAVTTNPTLQPWCRMAVAAVRGDSGANLLFKFELTQYVRFYDRKQQDVS